MMFKFTGPLFLFHIHGEEPKKLFEAGQHRARVEQDSCMKDWILFDDSEFGLLSAAVDDLVVDDNSGIKLISDPTMRVSTE